MVSLFFSPQGRIQAKEFWIGFVVITIVSVGLDLIQNFVLPPQGGARLLIAPLQLAMIYPFICVYGKRFHDAGKSAWMVLAVIGVQFVAIMILAGVLIIPMLGEIQEMMGDLQGADPGSEEFQQSPEFQAYQATMRDRVAVPMMIGSLTVSVLVAYVVSILKSDPDTNKFGPPPGTAAADTFA